ncbi:MAG: glycosyltransferase family 4 protein [Bacteroidaceae bacterium]|nr:glycosyltransferase family 4 protein [Bacteroidaceae bacterium]
MRILIPFSYYHPEQCAGLFVIDDMTAEAARQGISSLITVPTPTRNVEPGAKWSRDESSYDGKVKIHRFCMFKEGKNPVLRALRYVLCEIVQLHYMLWKKYDVAFIDSTPPIQGLKLPVVRLLRKKPIVYNAQDLFPETLSGAGLAKSGGLLWKIGLWVSKVTFRNSDKIIAISEDIKRGIVARGVPEEKIEVIYNWVDEKAVRPVAKEENPLFEEFGLDQDKFTVVYAGNLGNAQNISIVLDAAGRLPEVQFAIFGTGGLEEEIRSRIEKEGLKNVQLNPLQPMERVSQVYSLGDACVVSCKAGLGGSAMPSKTWSIMSCGRPVIASFDEGELKDIIEKNECGVFVHAGKVKEFVEAVRALAADPGRCAQMGLNARQFILQNLTKEVGTQKYVDVIKSFEKNE